MNNNLTIQELIELQKLPLASALPLKSNRNLYNVDLTEDAVCPPKFAPLVNAFIFYSKKGKAPWFRKSESEPTYSKDSLIKDFGFKSKDFNGVPIFSTIYCNTLKSHLNLYCLSEFKGHKNVLPSFPLWYSELERIISLSKRTVFLKLHSGNEYNISVSLKSIRIEFNNFTIIHKVTLKDLCLKRITTLSSSPKDDLRQQVILPLVKIIDQIKSDLLTRLSDIIYTSKKEIEITSLDKGVIKQSLKDFFSELRVENDRQITHASLMSKEPYYNLFPCRQIVRNITVYIAPTNAGKTYRACNEIKRMIDSTGNNAAQCFFPLRALAAQLKDEFINEGYPCDLITGNEREYSPGARITSCTTEIMDPGEFKDMIFIDECQMIFDLNKQAAYTRAILGAYCHELKLAVAPFFADALIKVLQKYTNDKINIVKLERLCPLHSCGNVSLNQIQKGDVVVAYRTKSIHIIAESLKERGLKAGVIYGRMSPSARRSMIKGFMDKDCDCLVATDAIGMGLSIPAKRVLIAEGTKYDGILVRPLEDEEIRQVAGRAGRFGFYNEGFYGALDISSLMESNYSLIDINRIDDAMVINESFKAPDNLSVLPDKNIMRSVVDFNLEATLNIWNHSVIQHDNITVSEDGFKHLISKSILLDKSSINSRELLVSLLFIVYNEDKNGIWQNVYQNMVFKVSSGQRLNLEDYYMIDFDSNRNEITDYEDLSMYLTLLGQFQRVFPDLTPTEDQIMHKQEQTGDLLSSMLLKLYTGQ